MATTRLSKLKSPCIGACSTAFGDRVCRGCKRFYFEVDHWNRLATKQRDAVWMRLRELRAVILREMVIIDDISAVKAAGAAAYIADVHETDEDVLRIAYQLLRQAASLSGSIEGLGFRVVGVDLQEGPVELLRRIEERFYDLSVAHYERYFGIDLGRNQVTRTASVIARTSLGP